MHMSDSNNKNRVVMTYLVAQKMTRAVIARAVTTIWLMWRAILKPLLSTKRATKSTTIRQINTVLVVLGRVGIAITG